MTRTAFLFLSAWLLAAPAARAQSPLSVDAARWSPWLGCWMPAATSRADSGTQVCIVPTADGRGVRMLLGISRHGNLESTEAPDAAD